jgi:tRNA(adenine34) deaminase
MSVVDQARIRWLASRLDALRAASPPRPDDRMGERVCMEALEAVREGNYGVGAVLADESGAVLVRTHNQVFEPAFRSDGHAEMVAVSLLEEQHPEIPPASLTLYVSLEPCPMCMARLKLAGIGKVRFLSPDPAGGMVHRHQSMPPIWRLLNPGQDFAPADVSPGLRRLAGRIFQVNLRALRRRLVERIQPRP